jgi:hypothetical protein
LPTLSERGANPCPHAQHTLSTLYGSSSQPFCPNAMGIIRSAATTPAYRIGCSSISSCRSCSSALAYERREDRRGLLLGEHPQASARGVDRARGDGAAPGGMVLDAYDRMIGLDVSEVAVDCCITKAPCGGEKAGRSPVDRGKRGISSAPWSSTPTAIPLGAIAAPAKAATTPRYWANPRHHGGSRRVARADERTPPAWLRLRGDPPG